MVRNKFWAQNKVWVQIDFRSKQAGAELCQAQGKLRLARLLSYLCLINLVSLVLVGYRMGVDMFILVSLEW